MASCFSDVAVLDTAFAWPAGPDGKPAAPSPKWIRPRIGGARVSPRAGHSGTVVGDAWYIVGGGNNVNGARAVSRGAPVAESMRMHHGQWA